jgi:RNA polymerase sigma-70 factor (ECF subfamily)
MDDVQRRSRLEGLFSAHAGAVRAYARRRVDPVAADDAVSEVFVIAWRRLDDVPDDALPWLLGLASEPHTAEWRAGEWSRVGYEPRSTVRSRRERWRRPRVS